MKKGKLVYLGFLIAIWFGYGIWEYHVFQWAKTEPTAVIRVDLVLILPVLLVLSIVLLYKLFKKK